MKTKIWNTMQALPFLLIGWVSGILLLPQFCLFYYVYESLNGGWPKTESDYLKQVVKDVLTLPLKIKEIWKR